MPSTISTHYTIKSNKIFNALLSFYPDLYRKKYGNEMRILFEDLYREHIEIHGSVGISFWSSIFFDTIKEAGAQHVCIMKRQGVRKYLKNSLHLNIYNIVGAILLFPFASLLLLDILGRIAQGNITHYNRSWYAAITQSTLYQEPIVLKALFVYAPLAAVLLNFVPVIFSLSKQRKKITSRLLLLNSFAFLIIILGIFIILFIYGHDFIPCTTYELLRRGIGNLFQIVSVCRNA